MNSKSGEALTALVVLIALVASGWSHWASWDKWSDIKLEQLQANPPVQRCYDVQGKVATIQLPIEVRYSMFWQEAPGQAASSFVIPAILGTIAAYFSNEYENDEDDAKSKAEAAQTTANEAKGLAEDANDRLDEHLETEETE